MQDFLNEEKIESIAKVKFEHYDKKRKIKLRQI